MLFAVSSPELFPPLPLPLPSPSQHLSRLKSWAEDQEEDIEEYEPAVDTMDAQVSLLELRSESPGLAPAGRKEGRKWSQTPQRPTLVVLQWVQKPVFDLP